MGKDFDENIPQRLKLCAKESNQKVEAMINQEWEVGRDVVIEEKEPRE